MTKMLLSMLTLASSYQDLDWLVPTVVAVASSFAAGVFMFILSLLRDDPSPNQPRFRWLYLVAATFPVLHPLLFDWQIKQTHVLREGKFLDVPESLWALWFLGIPATLATIPTAIALAVTWRRPVVGLLAVGTTAALAVCASVADPQSDFDRVVGFWVFGAPAVWLVVVCWALKVLRPPAWSRAREGDDRCHACGYSTEGLKQAVCPECGTALSVQPAEAPTQVG